MRLRLLSELDAIRFCLCALRLVFSLSKSYWTLVLEFVSVVCLVSKNLSVLYVLLARICQCCMSC